MKDMKMVTSDRKSQIESRLASILLHLIFSFCLPGGLSVAVPGELMGYWEAYKKYKSGNVEWGELVQPTIDLCREGIIVTPYLAKLLKQKEEDIKQSVTLR